MHGRSRRRRELPRPRRPAPMHMETSNIDQLRPVAGRRCRATCVHLLQYLLTRTGPLAGNVFESVAFLRTDPSPRQARRAVRVPAGQAADQPEDPVPARPRLRDQPGRALSQEPRHRAARQRRSERRAADRPAPARASGRHQAADPRAPDRPRRLRQRAVRPVRRHRSRARARGARPTRSSTPTSARPATPCTTRSAPAAWARDEAAVVDPRAARERHRRPARRRRLGHAERSSAATPTRRA